MKPPLNVPKYKGTSDDVLVYKWLLFDMKAAEATWTHCDRVSHFKGGAFKWYLTTTIRHGTI
ncbi:hypothetical protein HPB50_018518 [Hyalomma asiaticum]|uniref:Uncharacterized protein n=1 Tax=Hyalomma asiaticum TaxID=266040 RepID=A0ACB7TKC9_HYAAI|nr:hypothetical protein HPB50_018518 [Hyalomma asiaticum]